MVPDVPTATGHQDDERAWQSWLVGSSSRETNRVTTTGVVGMCRLRLRSAVVRHYMYLGWGSLGIARALLTFRGSFWTRFSLFAQAFGWGRSVVPFWAKPHSKTPGFFSSPGSFPRCGILFGFSGTVMRTDERAWEIAMGDQPK